MTITQPVSRGKTIWLFMRLHTWRGRFAWSGAIALMVAIICWLLMRMTPGWYRPLDPGNEAVNSTALRAQTLLTFELRRAGQAVPQGRQRWTITQDEINSFLAVTTAPPFNADGSRSTLNLARNPVTDPFIVFSKGEVTLSARLTKIPGPDAQGGVGSVTFSVGIVNVEGKPMGLVKLTGVHAGLMPIPKSVIQSRMQAAVPALIAGAEQAAQIQLGVKDVRTSDAIVARVTGAVGNGEPFPLEYRVENRDLVIKELTVEEGRLTIVLEPAHTVTQPSPATMPVGTGN